LNSQNTTTQHFPNFVPAIEAKATNAKKVQFDLDGVINYRTESAAPYTMNGDLGGDYYPWPYTLGPHTLSVKAINFAGTASSPYVIHFHVAEASHFSHAVTGGPYTVVDTDGDDTATVSLDGTGSHTHRFPGDLVSYSWKQDDVQFSTLISPTKEFTVGVHNITLTVTDSGGSVAIESSSVTVLPSTFPDIAALNPNAGDIVGGYPVQIVGSGFAYLAPSDISVNFNGVVSTGSLQIQIIDSMTIQVTAPVATLSGSVEVKVTTPRGTSAPITFLYIDSTIPTATFSHGDVLTGISGPTAVAFGPDRKLYVGTQGGGLYKLTLNEQYQVINTVGPSYILNNIYGGWRSILGLSFHPGSTSSGDDPEVYVAHSQLFHGQYDGYVGKVSKVGGATLQMHTEVISGLPVSHHDHGVNGMDFGDHGELYIMVGGNTNAGVPGELTEPVFQDEKQLSAACLIAHLYRPDFNGTIFYDANSRFPRNDIEVFATGLRNPYDVSEIPLSLRTAAHHSTRRSHILYMIWA
jgi:IPT/TIG domain